ncbi:glutathione S-transferase [Mycena vulgaris]|nr:glutathione S-transferase [Mycena vulgaris]
MAILKLYGMGSAACTRRVATILHEHQVPFELVEVDLMKGEHKIPAFLAKQPFGQIPYIDDEGFILYETRAICRYIAAKYPAAGLLPTEPKANALFEQAASTELTNFDPSATKLAVETFIMPCKGDPAVVAAQLAILDEKLDAYDVILGEHRYLAGDALTIADLFHLPSAALLTAGGSEIMTRKPNVARWYNELIARPSWVAYLEGVKTTTVY